jgi:hypothetical protein
MPSIRRALSLEEASAFKNNERAINRIDFLEAFPMSEVDSLVKTIADMPVAALIALVMLGAFALSAFAIWVVGSNVRRPQP